MHFVKSTYSSFCDLRVLQSDICIDIFKPAYTCRNQEGKADPGLRGTSSLAYLSYNRAKC